MELTLEGKVVSARFNDYLTEKYGNKEENLKGYTLHILIDKLEGGSIAKHCFELQCFSSSVFVDSQGELTYLKLSSPLYERNGFPITSSVEVAVGVTRISLVGLSFSRKIKKGKEYRMIKTGLPFCQIKRPLITDMWLEESEDSDWCSPNEVTSSIKGHVA